MIADLEPYATMRESGNPALGKVPEHWQVEPITRIGRLFKGRGGSKDDETSSGIPCVRYGDLYTRHESFITATSGFVSAARAAAYTPIEHGDVLFAASGETIEDIGRSAVNLLSGNARCGGDLIVLRPTIDVNPRFLGYAADVPAARQQKAAMGRGFTVVHIYSSELKRLVLALPSVPEQAAIVHFLDCANRRISQYISAKQQLLRLLEEQRRVVVGRAVTSGADPSVPTRPTGIPWLGEIPAHWAVHRVKTLFECLNARRIPLSSTQRGEMTTRDYDYYGASGVIDRVDSYLFDEDLVLIAEDGANLVLRNLPLALVARDRYWVNNHAHVLRPIDGDIDFLAARLEAMDFRPWITGAAQPKLTKDRLMSIALSVPEPAEQRAIMAYVRAETDGLVRSLNTVRSELELMLEYRTRLVADVVTGKLDVREAAARLPAELKPFDDDAGQNHEETEDDLDAGIEAVEA